MTTGKSAGDAAKRAITIIIAAPVVAAVVASSIVVAVVAAAEVVPLLLHAAGDLDGAVLVACGRAAFWRRRVKGSISALYSTAVVEDLLVLDLGVLLDAVA